MSRIRTVKPELFKHEDLFEAEISSKLPLRLAFIALFTCCDREGRFKWQPRRLKLDLLPYDENIDIKEVLEKLAQHGFVQKYEYQGKWYGCIPSWTKHQQINNREIKSDLPAPQAIQLAVNETNSIAINSSIVAVASSTDALNLNHPCVSQQPLPCQEIKNNTAAPAVLIKLTANAETTNTSNSFSVDASTPSQKEVIKPSYSETKHNITMPEPIQPSIKSAAINDFIASNVFQTGNLQEAASGQLDLIQSTKYCQEIKSGIPTLPENQLIVKDDIASSTTNFNETNTNTSCQLNKSLESKYCSAIKNDFPVTSELIQATTNTSRLVDIPTSNFNGVDACLTHESRVPHASNSRQSPVIQPSQPCTRGIWNMEYGKEYGKEHGREGEPEAVDSKTKPQDLNFQMLEVFKHWKIVMNHPDAQLDSKRKMLIKNALNLGYGVKQLCNAITGCSITPFNMGYNEQGQRYDGLHIILRDADQIDRFIYYYHKPPQPFREADQRTQGNINAMQRWLNKKMQEGVNNAESRFN